MEQIDHLIMHSSEVRENLVGQSPAWISALRRVVESARFTDGSALIIGESGTARSWLRG